MGHSQQRKSRSCARDCTTGTVFRAVSPNTCRSFPEAPIVPQPRGHGSVSPEQHGTISSPYTQDLAEAPQWLPHRILNETQAPCHGPERPQCPGHCPSLHPGTPSRHRGHDASPLGATSNVTLERRPLSTPPKLGEWGLSCCSPARQRPNFR